MLVVVSYYKVQSINCDSCFVAMIMIFVLMRIVIKKKKQ